MSDTLKLCQTLEIKMEYTQWFIVEYVQNIVAGNFATDALVLSLIKCKTVLKVFVNKQSGN